MTHTEECHPWSITEDAGDKLAGRFLKNADDCVVAYIDCPDPDDARLIEAAPELLEALERVMIQGIVPEHWVSYSLAMSAIAKARGE